MWHFLHGYVTNWQLVWCFRNTLRLSNPWLQPSQLYFDDMLMSDLTQCIDLRWCFKLFGPLWVAVLSNTLKHTGQVSALLKLTCLFMWFFKADGVPNTLLSHFTQTIGASQSGFDFKCQFSFPGVCNAIEGQESFKTCLPLVFGKVTDFDWLNLFSFSKHKAGGQTHYDLFNQKGIHF